MSGKKERRPRRANGAKVAQLRRKIDRGQFRDKVAGSDPTVTPLGTDDEAAGLPARPEEVERIPGVPDRALHGTGRGPAPMRTGPIFVAYAAPVVAVIMAAVVAWIAL